MARKLKHFDATELPYPPAPMQPETYVTGDQLLDLCRDTRLRVWSLKRVTNATWVAGLNWREDLNLN